MVDEGSNAQPAQGVKATTGLNLLKQVFGESDGDGKIGAAKVFEHGEVYPNHFSAAVEERPARTAGRGCRIVNNLVLQHVADMSLRGGRPDQLLRSDLRHDLADVF